MFGRKFGYTAAVTAVFLAFAGLAEARTVTFSKVKNYFEVVDANGQGSPYRERGVTVTALNGVLASDFTPGTVRLDDSGSDLTTGLKFTMNRTFSASAFAIFSLGYDFLELPNVLPRNIQVSGYLGGALVAEKGLRMSDSFLDDQTFKLGSAFELLDTLVIELVYPRRGLCNAPCASLELDWVKLEPTPVPLPASAGLLGAAGLMLWGIARRRRA
jgi:hypothetical protein